MTERLAQTFHYDSCDVPAGESLHEWRCRQSGMHHRRTQLTSGVLAALATIAPIVLSVRSSRTR